MQLTGAVAADGVVGASRPGRRPRLTVSEQEEIVRLYRGAMTSPAEIRARFRIGAPTLYRLLQKRGVAAHTKATSGRTRAKSPAKNTSTDTKSRARHAFSVTFRIVRFVEAGSMLDVMRQVELFGATEIEEISRQ